MAKGKSNPKTLEHVKRMTKQMRSEQAEAQALEAATQAAQAVDRKRSKNKKGRRGDVSSDDDENDDPSATQAAAAANGGKKGTGSQSKVQVAGFGIGCRGTGNEKARKLKEAAEKDAMMKSHIGAAERAAQRARAASSRPASAAPRPPTTVSREESVYGTDFVRQNSTMTVAEAAAKGKERVAEMRRAQEETRRANDFIAKRDYGRVPDYLVERKLELAERERERREKEERAHIPPGMRVLPEDERLRTLEILAENRQDVEEKLLALPIAKDGTPVVHRRKAELEARLAEIEDAQRIFGRSTVLVRA